MSARPDDLRSHLQEAISTLTELRRERDELLRQTHEPIAVIGMGCRLPGGGSDPEAFWAALLQGVDAVGEIPVKRWPPGIAHPTIPGTRWAGLLDQIDQFDARFFGLSPRESVSLDPQQRLLLEVAWEALEHAGQPADQLISSRTGVFIGMMNLDYRDWLKATGATGQDAYGATGNALCTAAGRISYILGLQGPCIAVDTACSSSLVAVHLACQSLRSGESTMAIVGGVNLIASSVTMQLVGSTQALSPDGRCRTFDARANGTVRAEGCGVVILKRLSVAQRAGDPILALIRGSAVNHDGQSTGFTAPSVLAQQILLRQALANAQVEPSQIGYFEAHGTGTALGDPIEMEALKEVLGQPRPDGSECTVSSVKTNLGHLEAAAGITGLIKTVLVLKKQRVPRHLHFQTLNPRISLAGTPLIIPTTERSWPAGDGPRFAGISSFGLSGTNANAVLEVAPPPADRQPLSLLRDQVLTLTAKTEAALRALVEKYRVFLAERSPDASADLLDIAYTASTRRTHYANRLAVVGRSKQEWLTALSAFSSGKTPPGLACGQVAVGRSPKLVFVFSGQGSQWLGMGKQLLAEEPVFRAAITDCEAAMQKEVGWSLTEELLAEPARSNMARSDVMQPMVFAIAVAVAKLYLSWGVEADAVIGHSMGEVAAAYICGALSLADAVRIICRRSLLMQKVSGRGAVAQLDASFSEVQQLAAGDEDQLAVAGSNGPRSTVVSGELTAMERFLDRLPSAGISFRRVRMDVASHSPQMDLLRDDLLRELASIRSKRTQLTMYSTVSGEEVQEGALNAAYWYRNMRDPVLLWPLVEMLRDRGYDLFVEVGPHPVLISALQDGFRHSGKGGTALGTLRREQPELRCLKETLGQLYVLGHKVSWARLYSPGAQCVQLPTYPWQRERYWLDDVVPQQAETRRQQLPLPGATAHSLLGEPIAIATQLADRCWQQTIVLDTLPYLRDHRVQGEVVFPGCGYVEMAISAARKLRPTGTIVLTGMRFERMLVLSDKEDKVVQTVSANTDADHVGLRIFSREGEKWSQLATGTVSWEQVHAEPQPIEEYLSAIRQRCLSRAEAAPHYKHMQELGIDYGPSFQGTQELWLGEREGLARVVAPPAVLAQLAAYELHPAWLDACLHSAMGGIAGVSGSCFVAAGIERLEVYRAPTESAWVHFTLDSDEGGFTAQLLVLTPEGQPILRTRGVRIERIAARAARPADTQEDWLYEVRWEKQEPAQPDPPPDAAREVGLLFVDREGIGDAVCNALLKRGGRWIKVQAGEQYQQIGPDHYQINPTDVQGYHALLQAALGDRGCTAIVHMWSLGPTADGPLTKERLAHEQSLGCRSVLNLVQVVLRSDWRQLPRLWLVTRGTQGVTSADTALSVAHAPLWGFGQAIAREHPELACKRIDLSASITAAEVANLVRELQLRARDEQVALRGEERYLARLVRAGSGAPQKELLLQQDGTYLVSGGLSGLGLSAAEDLVSLGARHLVLLARSTPEESSRQVIQRMQAAGAQVTTAQVDVADCNAVVSLVAELRGKWPPVRGVIHSAAVLHDGIILEQTWERFELVMAPKMYGAWNLHLATLEQPLDFFVGYSSAASLLGVPGQANYVAASAFVDALAHYRRRSGLCGLSINWGAILGKGIGARVPDLIQRFAARGMESLNAAETSGVLVHLLKGAQTQVGVMKLDQQKWAASFPNLADSSYWKEILHGYTRSQGTDSTTKVDWLRTFLAADSAELLKLLEQFLTDQLSQVLRLASALIDIQTPFLQFGFDSLMAVELRNRLDAELRIAVPISFLLKDADIKRLAAYVRERLPETVQDRGDPDEIEEGAV